MASYEKRSGAWRARVTVRGSPRESQTFDTLAAARAWAAQREGELRAGKRGQIIPRTVAQALAQYAATVAPGHRGARWEQVRCKKLAGQRGLPFRHRLLAEVRPADIAAWRDDALTKLAPASVRREMGLLSLVFERARLEWGWLADNPMAGVRRPPNPPGRSRTFADAEVERLLLALGYERGTAPVTTGHRVALALLLALETAMRASELCSIRSGMVDAEARCVRLTRTKTEPSREVPLSRAALALLGLVPDGLGLTPATLDVVFRRARDAAGLAELHFHDSRATAITRLSKRLDILELARMVGHRDLNSLQVYYRRSSAEIAARLD